MVYMTINYKSANKKQFDNSMIIKNGVEEYSPRQGTGSYPLPPQGWQLAILFAASHDPFSGPYFRIASIAYWLQVGVYRHAAGKCGDIAP